MYEAVKTSRKVFPWDIRCNGRTYARCNSESDARKVANALNVASLLIKV